MRSDNMPRPFAPEHGEEAASPLQRDIELVSAALGIAFDDADPAVEAWQRIRARLTPDRERVARAIQNAHGPMHPDFAFALADAAIAAMGEAP